MSSPFPPVTAAKSPRQTPESAIQDLIAIMARLRDPAVGCAWDVAQTSASIAPYTIEEAYEVVDAIERGDVRDLQDELGDLLLQVIFHARIAEEAGAFDFAAVAQSIADKLIRRHPHVFTDQPGTSGEVHDQDWESIKALERATKARSGVLDDVPAGLPALSCAVKLTKRAARVGFDWPDTGQVFDKLREEVAELEVEIDAGNQAKARAELGDVLFVLANLARKLDIEPEDALRATNAKFIRRFGVIEAALAAEGRRPEDADLAEMDRLWDSAKAQERSGGDQ